MGISTSTALLIGAGVTAAGTAATLATAPSKPKAPLLPVAQSLPDTTSEDAAKRQRATVGSLESTILTGPAGLAPATTAAKTLTGQ